MEKMTVRKAGRENLKALMVALTTITPQESAAGERVFTVHESMSSIPQGSEDFARDVARMSTYVGMPNGMMLVDEEGQPLVVVPAQVIDGQNPGVGFSEYGRVTEGYDSKWKEVARELASQHNPAVNEDGVSAVYNWNEIQKAISNPNESMSGNSIRSIIDVVYYFGDKPTRGAEDQSRIEYVTNNFHLDEDVPVSINRYLTELIAGVAAHESRFNDDLTSVAGAKGIFQFMPATVAGLGGYEDYVEYELETSTDENGVEQTRQIPVGLTSIPLTVQVEMAGKHFSNIYGELKQHITPEVWEAVRSLYENDEDFYAYFATPAMIGAFNTGGSRMAEAANKFFTPDRVIELQAKYENRAGYDVFEHLTEFAAADDSGKLKQYGPESSGYVERSYGFALVLQRDYKQHRATQGNHQSASN